LFSPLLVLLVVSQLLAGLKTSPGCPTLALKVGSKNATARAFHDSKLIEPSTLSKLLIYPTALFKPAASSSPAELNRIKLLRTKQSWKLSLVHTVAIQL
jgi:hypothetical protein